MVHSSSKSRGKRPVRDGSGKKSKSAGLSKSNGGRSKQIKEITWDDDARREYLTGFSKRKKEQKDAARERAVKRDREARLQMRQELRDARRERAANNVQMAKDYYGGTEGAIETLNDEGGVDGPQASTSDIPGEQEFADEELVSRVVIEEMRLDGEFDNDNDAEEQDDEENMFAAIAPSAIKAARQKEREAEQQQQKSRLKTKDGPAKRPPKRFTYETKAARKAEALKQKKRRIEKADPNRRKQRGKK